MLLIYYSVSFRRDSSNYQILDQLEASLGSLRRHNTKIDVWVFWYGHRDPERYERIRRLATRIIHQGAYFDSLAIYGKSQALAFYDYPIMHRYLNFLEIDRGGADRVLYLDCDTYFFDDVGKLFDRYQAGSIHARAEIGSSLHDPSHHDSAYLDEQLLSDIAAQEATGPIVPVNAGLILYNQPPWRQDPSFVERIFHYCWRFLLWMADNPQRDSRFPEGRGVKWARRHLATAGARADQDQLPFPSPNRWIVEEVALWLALAGSTRQDVKLFDPTDVTYYAEQHRLPREARSIVCHYFSSNSAGAAKWWTAVPPTHAPADPSGPADRIAIARSSIVIPQILMESKLMYQSGGFSRYSRLPDATTLAAMREEARVLRTDARTERRWTPSYPGEDASYQEDRKVAPRRCKRSLGGGPVQAALYRNPELSTFLSQEVGLPVQPSGNRGSYSYYIECGDFIGLHRDTDYCDLVMLTLLEDNSEPGEAAGSLILYPGRITETCEQIGRTPEAGALPIKLAIGETIIMFGGAVPHRVAPVRKGQSRTISALCFSIAPA